MSMIDARWEVWDNKALTSALHSYAAENFFDLEENGVTDEQMAKAQADAAAAHTQLQETP